MEGDDKETPKRELPKISWIPNDKAKNKMLKAVLCAYSRSVLEAPVLVHLVDLHGNPEF